MLRVLDLFSGIGGFSLGLERAGMKTVAFVEREPFCQRVLAKHWPEVPIYDDVKTYRGDEHECDVVCGGFPCQDISFAGRGAGLAGERSGLWSEMARIIGVARPRYVIVENVAALLGRGLGTVLGDLAEIGYDAEWHCIPASYVGAPHRRDRVWIVAYPKQEQRFRALFQIDDGKKATRRIQAIRCPHGDGPEVGTEMRSIPGKWLDQSSIERMADGVSDWPHRLGALGNAVVPQIPEMIGRAILETADG